jgi:hypothetical protein
MTAGISTESRNPAILKAANFVAGLGHMSFPGELCRQVEAFCLPLANFVAGCPNNITYRDIVN